MRKIIWLLFVVVFLVIGGLILRKEKREESSPVIGANLPLTGSLALAGELSRRGIEIALQELREQENIEVRVMYADNESIPKQAISAYRKLVETDGARTMLAFSSPTAMAIKPLANADKVILLATASAPDYAKPPRRFSFRMIGDAASDARFAARTATNHFRAQRIAILAEKNDYGSGLADFFMEEAGVERIIIREDFLADNFDNRGILTKIKSKNPDLIYLPSFPKEAGRLVLEARNLGLTAPILCTAACENSDFITAAGSAGEGVFVLTFTNDTTNEFARRYKKKYGDDPNYWSIRMYDGTKILVKALRTCRSQHYDSECLTDTIATMKNFSGASFPITFDGRGNIEEHFVLKVVKNGKFIGVTE